MNTTPGSRPSSRPAVTVIIVTFNAGGFLQPCIDALSRQTFTDFEAIIVDNNSTDGAIDTLALPDERFTVLRQTENLGFAAANNLAARRSGAPWIATLNPDTEAAPRWLAALLDTAARWPGAASVGSTQIRLHEPDILDGAGDVWHAAGVGWRALEGRPLAENPEEGETFAACAAGALYRADAFEALGGFDEHFFCYCEDLDLGFRLRAQGWAIVQSPDALLLHAGSGTTGRYSEFTVFHGHRNRVWTFVKNTPGLMMWLLLPAHIAINLRMLQKAPSPEYAAALKRAYAAAWRGLLPVLRARWREQGHRRVGMLTLARALAWRPALVAARAALLDEDGHRVAMAPARGLDARK